MDDVKRLQNAKFEAVLRLAVIDVFKEEMASMPSDEDIEKMYPFSERHERRMKQLFSRERRLAVFATIRKVSYRIAAVIVITISLLFSALLLNEDVRGAIVRTIIEWFDEFTRFSFTTNTEALDKVEWQPTYLPEGFEESDTLVFSMLTRIEYANEDGVVIIFNVMTAEGSSVAVDNENSYYYTSINNGIEYYVFTATDKDIPTNVIWEYEGLVFSINALFDDDELLKMAFSTQKE